MFDSKIASAEALVCRDLRLPTKLDVFFVLRSLRAIIARWNAIKRTYNRLPRGLKVPFTLVVISPGEAKSIIRSLITLKPGDYVRSWTQYDRRRGMSRWRDIID